MQSATQSKQTSELSFAHQLYQEAEDGEVAALVQFAFFRPHLAELLTACAEASLDVLVLKGAALAETVYPRPSLRRFGDLDVLIHAADASRARTLLEAQGYTADPFTWDDFAEGRVCQANFFKHTPRGSVVVELHTALLNNALLGHVRAAQDGVWARARAVRLTGEAARVLGPEDQLLHLCLHLAGHYFHAPQSLRDIAYVCAAQKIDWPLLVRLAREAQAAPACFAGLLAAARLLDTPTPPSVLDALAPRRGRRALETLALARAADLAGDRTDRLRGPLLWHLLGSPAARLAALRHILFPTRPWLVRHYYHDLFDAVPDHLRPAPPSRQAGAALRRAHAAFLLRRVLRRS